MKKPDSLVDVAIIGAGPYGLSLAAHLRARGVEYKIFGEPMGSWKNNMPEGMLLKSYPWASNLSDSGSKFTVKSFCVERALPYHDVLRPLPLDQFINYGQAFQARYVPDVERKVLVSLEAGSSYFRATLDNGESVHARRVIVAVGLSPFKRLPREAEHLPTEVCSHSGEYGPLDPLDGKDVIVVGSGSSATDLAALLHERGSSVSLVARAPHLNFAGRPRVRTLVERITVPTSGIGNGWVMGTCAKYPQLVRLLPQEPRVRLAKARALGPLGGAFMTDRVVGKVPLLLGCALKKAETRNGKVNLHLVDLNGKRQTVNCDHVIFATGYTVDVDRLDFLDRNLLIRLRLIERAPQLSAHYEASVPGLHFIGPAAANSFGPVCRFVYGAYHPARHLARYVARVLTRPEPVTQVQPVNHAVLQ